MSLSPTALGPAGRNQFLLGPAYLQRDTWRQFDLGEHLKLSVQSQLEIEQATNGRCRLTLLGYMLDWLRPEESNADILQRLIDNSQNLDSCLKATFEIGGRWVLIYQDDAESVVFHDAAGLRQVCYAMDSAHNQLWIGSQVDLLSEMTELVADPEALSFIRAMGNKDPEYWWPGNRLPFAASRTLLPNHCLNLSDGECSRYWPRSVPETLSREECCRRVSNKLVGIMSAAQNRWELALGLSAGWDSRVLLAASRGIIENMTMYTVQTTTMAADHNDVAIPRRLAKHLGLNHVEIRHADHATEDFQELFRDHTWRPHQRFAAGAQAEFEQFRYAKVAVIGNLSEVAKLPYRHQLKVSDALDGEMLATLVGMNGQKFATEAMEEWLASLHISQKKATGYDVLDLFYWEQRIGRWLAANLVEFDFAWQDILVPFNIRSLICDLLATDEKYRKPGTLHLYVEIMQSLWPEVLQVAINPKPTPRIWQRIRRRIRRQFIH